MSSVVRSSCSAAFRRIGWSMTRRVRHVRSIGAETTPPHRSPPPPRSERPSPPVRGHRRQTRNHSSVVSGRSGHRSEPNSRAVTMTVDWLGDTGYETKADSEPSAEAVEAKVIGSAMRQGPKPAHSRAHRPRRAGPVAALATADDLTAYLGHRQRTWPKPGSCSTRRRSSYAATAAGPSPARPTRCGRSTRPSGDCSRCRRCT